MAGIENIRINNYSKWQWTKCFKQKIEDGWLNEKQDSSIQPIKIQLKDNSYHEASSTSFVTRFSYEIHSHNNLHHSHFNNPQNFRSSLIDFVSFNSLVKMPRHKTKNNKTKLNQMRKYLLDNSF